MFQALIQEKVVAVVRRLDVASVVPVIGALLEGGIRWVEVTMDSVSAALQIEMLTQAYGEHLMVGAGTVFTTDEVHTAVEAGAKFLVCPHLDVELLDAARVAGVPMIPGVMTPSEIRTALKAGASFLKVFPASTLGPGFVRDVRGPFGNLQTMVTGGLNEDNFMDFLNSGASAVGLGSFLFPKADIAQKNWSTIRDRAKRVTGHLTGN